MTQSLKAINREDNKVHVVTYRRDFIGKLAFTMAEILISLTIIGVIAAITLPALRANINESTWRTQRKALYSRLSQAISMMPSLNGYGIVMGENGIDETATASKAAQAFITDGLSKVLKINNICNGATVANLEKCGFPKKFTKMGTNTKSNTPTKIVDLNNYFNFTYYSQINTNSAAFETANGESIVVYYNPNCTYTSANNYMQPTMCANFIYDLNGKKGPNKVSKDIGFMTAFYPTDSQVVSPYPLGTLTVSKANHPYSISWFNASCRQKYGDDARAANIEEIKSVFTNNKLGHTGDSTHDLIMADLYYSITMSSDKYIAFRGHRGIVEYSNMTNNNATRIFCVKK